MERYANFGGGSSVAAFEFGEDWITIQFRDWSRYLYTYQSAGSATIERMKELAVGGRGLGRYINRYVKKGYASKRR